MPFVNKTLDVITYLHPSRKDGVIQWIDESFPDDVRSLLVYSEDNDDEYKDEPETE